MTTDAIDEVMAAGIRLAMKLVRANPSFEASDAILASSIRDVLKERGYEIKPVKEGE